MFLVSHIAVWKRSSEDPTGSHFCCTRATGFFFFFFFLWWDEAVNVSEVGGLRFDDLNTSRCRMNHYCKGGRGDKYEKLH